jgi:hypothetical protein
MVQHDPATTQAPAVAAIAGENIRHQERIVTKRLNQGELERIHPGMTTLGGAAIYLQTGQGVELQTEHKPGRWTGESEEEATDDADKTSSK